MKVLQLNSQNFEEEVLQAEQPVLVDFYADWCGPCKMMAPVIEKIAEEIGDKAKICKINVDDAQSIAAQYGVMSIPTFIAFKQGEPVNKTVGIQSEDVLRNMLGI